MTGFVIGTAVGAPLGEAGYHFGRKGMVTFRSCPWCAPMGLTFFKAVPQLGAISLRR